MSPLDNAPAQTAHFRSRRISGAALIVALALALGAALTAGRAADVWRTGAFLDTDDAMRMSQVRDFLAGQSWFDLLAHRLDPPAAIPMHWSRVVDLPLAALMKIFGLFAPPTTAEALTRIAFPLLLLAALYAAVAWTARAAGALRLAPFLAVALAFLGAPFLVQFVAGRVDHHGPQILLLTLATGATLAAFEPARARLAALAGALAALSLAISLENLPFLALLAAAPALAWIIDGERQRGALVAYALGLAGGLTVLFVATVPPARYFSAACDAFSFAHLSAGLTGALGLLALAALGPRLSSRVARGVAAAAFGLAPLIVLRAVAPACMGDPFVGLDPVVRAIWLRNVAEVQSLPQYFSHAPSAAIVVAAPTALAALAAFALGLSAHGVARARVWLLAALVGAGLAMSFWGVRALTSVAPLVALAGASAIAQLIDRARMEGAARGALAILAMLPFAPLAYAVLLPADKANAEAGTLACLRPETMRTLDAAPPGLVIAPVSAGSHIVALTHHAAVAAPYHRNNHGNRLSIDTFRAEPEAAKALARGAGAAYLLACPHIAELRMIADENGQSLAAALVAGHTPGWLEKIDGVAPPNTLYRVR